MSSLIRFSQILCLSFMLLRFQVQSSSPSQPSLDSPPHLCRPEERFALLDFKSTTNLAEDCFRERDVIPTWIESKDCCLWKGITCDKVKGHVIGLDLSSNCFDADLTTNSSLFRLDKLQSLNLAYNFFSYPNLSFGFDRWKSLIYLNLSDSVGYMDDSLPFDEIFLLPKLISLDLSYNYRLLLDNIKFQMLVHNLTELRFLILDSVNMSLIVPSSWLNLTSSLEYLSLRDCSLQGNFPNQVFRLRKLVSLDLSSNDGLLLDSIKFQMLVHKLIELRFLILDYVNMSLVVLSSSLNLTSPLEHLSLRNCYLQGNFPSQVFQLPSLQFLDLSYNFDLGGNLPESNLSSILKYLNVAGTNFSGELPYSLGNLKLMKELNLASCQFYGSIPRSLANLTELTQLDFSFNHLRRQIPDVFGKIHKLTNLSLDANNFSGEIPTSIFNLTRLTFLSLSSNKLIGSLPHNISGLSFLHEFSMNNNFITGHVPSWLLSLPSLSYLNLRKNCLTGPIDHVEMPSLILREVYLSNNEISGSIPNSFFDLVHLTSVDLSSNNLTGTITPDMLSKLVNLEDLDLSNNSLLSLSNKGTAVNYSFLSSLWYLKFSSCNIHKLPSFLKKAERLEILDISKNKISGNFTYCNFTSLEVLVLANNRLEGTIPECLGNLSYLTILDLRMNKFNGRIPNLFDKNNWLVTLHLNGNRLEGILPRSLVNCSWLEILDVGNNNLNDTFPHWLGVLPSLKVLILRSNRFHGAINNSMPVFYFPQLRIIDVAQNDFMGLLPSNYFKILQGMRDIAAADKAKLEYVDNAFFDYYYDKDFVKVVMKGSERELVEWILKFFTTIDFSSNQFHGPIPNELGELNSLLLLNLSHNSLNGQIPSSFGKLAELESLDLSSNKLEGRIPEQLIKLTFLSVLNLSHNELVDHIPEGKQFNTFSNDSYIGNSGLCGFPLTKKCGEPRPPSSQFDEEYDSTAVFEWKFALAGYGCGLVLGLSLGYIAFTTGKPWWVVKKVEKYQQILVGRCNQSHKLRKTQKPNQRS